MKLSLTKEQTEKLRAFLDNDPDSEQVSIKEYVCDLYALDAPISLDIIFNGEKVFVDGAAVLHYDEDLDGWYIGDQIKQQEAILTALQKAGAL